MTLQDLPFVNAEEANFTEMSTPLVPPPPDRDLLNWISNDNSLPEDFPIVFNDIDPDFNFCEAHRIVEALYITEDNLQTILQSENITTQKKRKQKRSTSLTGYLAGKKS